MFVAGAYCTKAAMVLLPPLELTACAQALTKVIVYFAWWLICCRTDQSTQAFAHGCKIEMRVCFAHEQQSELSRLLLAESTIIKHQPTMSTVMLMLLLL